MINRRQSIRDLITDGFNSLNYRMDALQMTENQTQTDVDNATSAVTSLLTDVSAQTASILTDLTDLANSPTATINTSALNAIVSDMGGVQESLDAAVSQLNNTAAPGTSTPVPPVTTPAPVATSDTTIAQSAVKHAPELASPVGTHGASLMGLGSATPASAPAVPGDADMATRMDLMERKFDDVLDALRNKL